MPSLVNLLVIALSVSTPILAKSTSARSPRSARSLEHIEKRKNDITDAIVGGEAVGSSARFPWIVALQNKKGQFCGGALIAPHLVLTAAHCSDGASGTVTASAHRNNLNLTSAQESGIDFQVVRRINHPKYRNVKPRGASESVPINDISIWVVKPVKPFPAVPDPIPFRLATLPTLADPMARPKPREVMTVAGWGAVTDEGDTTQILRQARIPVIDQESCMEPGGMYQAVDETVICAAREKGGKDTCQGDSGGPLFAYEGNKPVVYGVVSWGDGCAIAGKP
ncbi:hypothetical protein HK102_006060, partial [Quaeritorhiza haematococci]